MKKASDPAGKTVVTVLTTDAEFEQSVRSTFGASGAIELHVVAGTISTIGTLDTAGVTVVIVDLDANRSDEMLALERFMLAGNSTPVVVVTQSFDAEVARSLLQMRVADFLVKPVQPLELVRTCARVARSSETRAKEAQIYTFIPAVGDAGDSDGAAAAQQRPARPSAVDLSGRSRFSAWRLRRLSRSRTAPGPQGNRAAAGAA